MKHKHSEVIKAFVDGVECEGWMSSKNLWFSITQLGTFHYVDDARIKTEPQQDVVDYMYVIINRATWANESNANLKIIFDGETGNLKSAEVIK